MSHVKEIQLYPTPLRTGHREGEYSLFCFVLSSPGLQKKKIRVAYNQDTHTHLHTIH